MPETVTSWGSGVFEGTHITSQADVTFPAGITHIPDRMFAATTRLVSMEFPATVETIGNSVFANSAIQNFTFPPLVTEISDNLFSSSGLRSITIPNTITRIGANAFTLSRLPDVTIPGSVKYIGTGAFNNSQNLVSVILNEGLDTIQTDAFRNITSLRTVNIPNSVRYLGAGAFWNSLITSPITIPGGITEIGDNTFRNTRIPSVVVPNSVKSIGVHAFSTNTALTSVEMGSGIETIEQNAFASCWSLGVVTVRAALPPTTTGEDTLNRNVFSGVNTANVILIVADEDAIVAYTEALVWQDFMLISTSISDGITALRNEIADLNEELEYLGESIDFFFEIVAELLGVEVEDLEDFMAIEDAIEALLEEIDILTAQLDECLAAQSSVRGLSNTILLEVSPNPVTNEVRITNEWAAGDNVEIFNSRGQNVFFQQGGIPGTTSELVINMSSFQAGNYIVRVGNRIAKVVKL
jgi:hypothetical protein